MKRDNGWVAAERRWPQSAASPLHVCTYLNACMKSCELACPASIVGLDAVGQSSRPAGTGTTRLLWGRASGGLPQDRTWHCLHLLRCTDPAGGP